MLISDQSKILKCPHCGALRYMINVLSGNSMGAVRWSDTKVEAPMMRSSSSVLRCPACKRYHFYSDGEIVGLTESHWESRKRWWHWKRRKSSECWPSWDCGTLSYQSLKEAFAQLKPTGDNEREIRIMLLNGYNDWYGGCQGTRQPSEAPAEERSYFEQNARRLIELFSDESPNSLLMRAELYRELGEFEQAISLLDRISKDSPFFSLAEQMHHYAEQHDCRVFAFGAPNSRHRRAPEVESEGAICKESEKSIRKRMRKERERALEDDLPY